MANSTFIKTAFTVAISASAALHIGPTWAQTQSGDGSSSGGLAEIVVTAQKRSESINSVPMTITAVSDTQLADLGIHSVDDLQKVVPGLSVATTTFGTPVYTLRGIGFYSTALSAAPAVSLYLDQTPLPFPVMARQISFDLKRVEVLKGPQGTLFGENSTGGAINYIAAKPTNEFSAGITESYSSFNTLEQEGYVSGPLTSTLNARLAVKSVQGDGWQQNYTTGATLGVKNQFAARLLLDWRPSDSFKATVNINGWRDQSDTQAAQLLAITQLLPANCTRGLAATPPSTLNCLKPAVGNFPVAPHNDRAADWNPDLSLKRKDSFGQFSVRMDYDISPDIVATSLSSYDSYHQDPDLDYDGTPYNISNGPEPGAITTVSQELRLSSSGTGRLRWIVGGNYEHDKINDAQTISLTDTSVVYNVAPSLPIYNSFFYSNSKNNIAAAFGNVDYSFTESLKGHAGIRYTDERISNVSGENDSCDGHTAAAFNGIIYGITGTPGDIKPCGTNTLTITPKPGGGFNVTHNPFSQKLDESNVSWRVGLDYKPEPGLLFYGNVSQGYKAGSFPTQGGTSSIQYIPAKQEKVLAYEIGTKETLFDRKLQLDFAIFYDQYTNKQTQGRILDQLGIFGSLDALVNVPKSRVYGAEAGITFEPVKDLLFSLGATYLNTRVTSSFNNYDPYANPINFKGLSFPFTPKISLVADTQYTWNLNDKLNVFAGVNAQYQSSTVAAFYNSSVVATTLRDPLNAPGATIPGDIFKLDGYALADLRAGLASPTGKWRATAWVRNVADKYYRTNVAHTVDTTEAYTGMPRTVGITGLYRF